MDSEIRITWDPVDGADFYMIYHFFVADCELSVVGRPGFCERLADSVAGTSYVHVNPDGEQVRHMYWVSACNPGGCSEIERSRPDILIENPAAVRRPTPAPIATPTAEPTATPRPVAAQVPTTVTVQPTATAEPSPTIVPPPAASTNTPPAAPTVVATPTHTAVQTPIAMPTTSTPPPTPIPVDTPTPAAVQTPVSATTPTVIPVSTSLPALPGTPPVRPSNVRYAIEGNSTTISWDAPPVGAEYYNVYFDDFFESGCTLNRDGAPRLCEVLATNVIDTTYVHADREGSTFYYWVNACNSAGCSPIDSSNPAMPIEPISAPPSNVSYVWDGATIRISWDVVDGADRYSVYYDDFHSSGCRLNRDGSTSFCEELAANVVEAFYVHSDPDSDDNHYWVVACNRGGCSDLGASIPATSPEAGSSGPVDMPTALAVLRFADSAPATRSIPENTPAGIYVGAPVSMVGTADFTYTMGGTDAGEFLRRPLDGTDHHQGGCDLRPRDPEPAHGGRHRVRR